MLAALKSGARAAMRGLTARRAQRAEAAATLLLLAACSGPPTVWKVQLRSPDGDFTAVATTLQNGGFGNADIETTVQLRSNHYPNKPQVVVGFSCPGPVPHPYTLDNVRNAGGTIGLKMTWLDSRHLEVTYTGNPDPDPFEVAQIWGVRITVRKVQEPAKSARAGGERNLPRGDGTRR